MSVQEKLSPNSLSFIALVNEYCNAIETAMNFDREQLVATMLKLLPRIYIVANDLNLDLAYSDYEIIPALKEEAYDQVRDLLAQIMSDEDVYLEVFVEDNMKVALNDRVMVIE